MKADVINEFTKIYGVDPKSMMSNKLEGMTTSQKVQLKKDMEIFGVDIVNFVIYKLESMLGEDYTVTRIFGRYLTDKETGEILEDEETGEILEASDRKDFLIVKKIPAEDLLQDFLIDNNLVKQNENFLAMFTDENEIDLESFLKIITDKIPNLSNWTVILENDSSETYRAVTQPGTETIKVNIAVSSDYLSSLVHEINHVLQYEFQMTRGFNSRLARYYPGFTEHVARNYTELVAYDLRRRGHLREGK